MPQKLLFNLILTTLITLPLAMTGCSFRKPLEKNIPKTEISTLTLREAIADKSNKDILEALDNLDLEELYRQGALDIAIQNKNLNIMTYLLSSRNFSSFAYNSTSKEVLEQNPALIALIEPYQTAQLMNFLIDIKNESTFTKWNESFLKNKINSGSCVRLFQTISDWYYYRGINNTSDGLLEITEDRFLDYFNNIANTSTCKNLKSELPVTYLYSWMQNELKIQFHRGLQSSRVVELLKTLTSFQNIAIEVSTKSGILRVDPRLLVLASSPNGENMATKYYWLTLLTPMISAQPIFYNIPFVQSTDECKDDRLCEEANTINVGIVLYWMGHPNIYAPSEETETPENPEDLP